MKRTPEDRSDRSQRGPDARGFQPRQRRVEPYQPAQRSCAAPAASPSALPFLEGLPERSAWAQSAQPVFSFYIVAACGVVGSKFFPTATGALTTAGLAGATDKATSVLAPHAREPAVHQGHQLPAWAARRAAGTPQGLCQALTATAPGSSGHDRVRRAASRPTW